MELTALTAVPIIIALTNLLKQVGLSNRLLPVANIVFGITVASVLFHFSVLSVVEGVIYGLSAAGLYRSAKVTLLGQ